MIEEEDVTSDSLFAAIHEVHENRASYIKAMEESGQMDSIKTIVDLIQSVSK